MSNWGQFLPIVLLVLVFWFIIVRPTRIRSRQAAETQRSLVPGTRIMLGSGIFGTVDAIGDETVDVRVAANTVITVLRQGVARIVPDEPAVDGDGE